MLDPISRFLLEDVSSDSYIIKDVDNLICLRYRQDNNIALALPSCQPTHFAKFKYKEKIILTSDEKDVIGFIAEALENEKGLKEITNVFVSPNHRGKGFSKILMNVFPNAQVLYVDPGNTIAKRLYETLGWKDTGLKRKFGGEKVRSLYYQSSNITLSEVKEKYGEDVK